MSYIPTYVNDDGDIWIERLPGRSWPSVQHEASSTAYESDGVAIYIGIEKGIRVSDEWEYPHSEDDEEPDEDGVIECQGCCRTIDAYHFRTEDRP